MFSFINNLLRKTGFEVKRFKKHKGQLHDLRIKQVRKSPIIFDVGANIGQSIDRYLSCFNNPKIYAFEPNNEAYEILKEKYSKNKKIVLNNFGLGEKVKQKKLNYTIKSGNSSFYNLNLKSNWIKERSKSFNVVPKSYVKKRIISEINTIDNFVKKHNIKVIDLLKIDTQGYEENVLHGAKNSLNKIKNIELEIMLDDCYQANTSFFHIEKILYPNKFRIFGMHNNKKHVFEGVNFGTNVFYSKYN